jgi:hypothetical protein
MRIAYRAIFAACVTALVPAPAGADELDRCRTDDAARIRFLETRLDERRSYADWWWKGWMTTYGVGAVVQGVRAGVEDDTGEQADYAVSAAKAAFGTTRPLPLSAERVRAPTPARRRPGRRGGAAASGSRSAKSSCGRAPTRRVRAGRSGTSRTSPSTSRAA